MLLLFPSIFNAEDEGIKNNRNQAKAFDIFHLLALFVHIESRFFLFYSNLSLSRVQQQSCRKNGNNLAKLQFNVSNAFCECEEFD
jgi:hypothetical protein